MVLIGNKLSCLTLRELLLCYYAPCERALPGEYEWWWSVRWVEWINVVALLLSIRLAILQKGSVIKIPTTWPMVTESVAFLRKKFIWFCPEGFEPAAHEHGVSTLPHVLPSRYLQCCIKVNIIYHLFIITNK